MKKSEFFKKTSKIHGVGIFTSRFINSGEKFYKVPMGQLSFSPKPGLAHIGKNIFVSDEQVLNHVNHSCEPNAEIVLGKDVWLRALKDIQSDKEIVVDYNKTEYGGKKIPCTCTSSKCRGYFLRIE